ncbi:hypothetical protein TRIP_B200384 [uncultured Desulfatiglans sp.]|uniref:Uncharacterized protein n=1 Tax=Uncultured Desulfatiglans sp. TaxID=1748965 RepID=A0A653A2L3_UNCDX|nr:hypothetical protein TRIP_B200384 [uncultured Desulfatiglans sp.]
MCGDLQVASTQSPDFLSISQVGTCCEAVGMSTRRV